MINTIGYVALVINGLCFMASQMWYFVDNIQRAQNQGYCFLIALAIAAYCFK